MSQTIEKLRNELLDRAICQIDRPAQGPFEIFKATNPRYKPQGKNCPYSKAFLEDLYINQGLTRRQIAESLDVTISVISNWFISKDIRLSEEQHSMATNGLSRELADKSRNERGLRSKQKAHTNTHIIAGYRFLHNPGHPMAKDTGYFQEHRHVVEAYLHRFLTCDEVVHHIDGNKANNDLLNLALFANDSQHKRFHRVVETWGFYFCGFSREKPELLSFESPVLWAGEWVDEIDLEKFAKANYEKLLK